MLLCNCGSKAVVLVDGEPMCACCALPPCADPECNSCRIAAAEREVIATAEASCS